MFPTVPPIHFPLPVPASRAIQTVPAVQAAVSINAQAALQIGLFSQTDAAYQPAASRSFSIRHHRLASPATPAVQAVQVQDLATVLHVLVRQKYSLQDPASLPTARRLLTWLQDSASASPISSLSTLPGRPMLLYPASRA